jgi:hypothetical protein
LWRIKRPPWLRLGFGLGIVFLFTAQVYYHYFALVVPFAALLAAPVVERFSARARRLVALAALLAVTAWGLDVGHGTPPQRLFVSASRFSQLTQTAAVLDRRTTSHQAVLSDQLQYPILAHRRAANYFWNMTSSISSAALIHRLARVAAVVETKGTDGYPDPFIDYLDDNHYLRVQTAQTVVWFTAKAKRDKDGDVT